MAADVLPIDGITHAIELAVAPVFLLSAVATLLGVLTGRLGRAVDRRRVLVSALAALDAPLAAGANGELALVNHRISIIYAAIALSGRPRASRARASSTFVRVHAFADHSAATNSRSASANRPWASNSTPRT